MSERVNPKRAMSDIVRLFHLIDAVNSLGLTILPLLTPDLVQLMAFWKDDGRPDTLTDDDRSFSGQRAAIVGEVLDRMSSDAIDIVELAQPFLARHDETRAMYRDLKEARRNVN